HRGLRVPWSPALFDAVVVFEPRRPDHERRDQCRRKRAAPAFDGTDAAFRVPRLLLVTMIVTGWEAPVSPTPRGQHLDADGNLTVVWQLTLGSRPSSCTAHFSAWVYASRSSLPRKLPRTSAARSTSTLRSDSCVSPPRSSPSSTTPGH